jgi:hypothetical protein
MRRKSVRKMRARWLTYRLSGCEIMLAFGPVFRACLQGEKPVSTFSRHAGLSLSHAFRAKNRFPLFRGML